MIQSSCICSQQPVQFDEVIVYKNETVFKRFEGTVIAKCRNCGVLKTFPAKQNTSYNPVQSRAELYEDHSEKFRIIFKPLADAVCRFKNSGRVLDVGCSSGILLEVLRERGFDVYGVEPHSTAYNAARKKFGNNITYGTAQTLLKQSSQQFDVVIYNHVLEHIPDPVTELSTAKKLLRPDGVLVIGVPNTENVIFMLRRKYWEPLMPNEHVWHFGMSYMKSLLAAQDFAIQKILFEDDPRRDYPVLKRIYFGSLSFMNRLMGTGEAMLIVAALH